MDSQTIGLSKLINKLKQIYSSCVITKTNANLQSLIPIYYINKHIPHLNFCKYLYIPLSDNLRMEYSNFRFSIIPEPLTIFYENINNKIIKGGIFRAIHLDGSSMNIVLLYNCRVFLKWHFLKYLEVNRIDTTQYNRYINSDVYLNEIIFNITKIDNENIFEASGNNLML
jgi:hypothetical protein